MSMNADVQMFVTEDLHAKIRSEAFCARVRVVLVILSMPYLSSVEVMNDHNFFLIYF